MLDDWRGLRAFRSLPIQKRAIVFYSEGKHDWPHLKPLVTHSIRELRQDICYVGSDKDDPGLALKDDHITRIRIGQGTARTLFFLLLEAGVMVMTLSDLNLYHIRRSLHPVHYVYVCHSMLSNHMSGRPGSIDHYDTIFCVGPHHVQEIRETEALCRLPAKELFEHGYGRLDSILERARQCPARGSERPLRVLIAPSWGAEGILETCGAALVDAFVAAGFHITVRPHPQLERRNPSLLASYRERYAGQKQVTYDDDIVAEDTLHDSDLMISDWSGAAMEFAFGLERPVLFIDVPRKVLNPDYVKYVTQPIDVALRPELGLVLSLDLLHEAPAVVRRLVAETPSRAAHLRRLRAQWVFNVGASGVLGAERIARIAATRQAEGRLV
jgi:YidC/Oxa1 family membrane protein insertase